MFLQSLTGWKNESDDFYEEAMDCFNQCLAFDDRFMITSSISELYFGYASHFLIEKNYDKAERYYNKALNKVKDFEGIYHTIFEYDIAVIHASLGYLYKLTDRDDESRLHVEASLEIVERLHLICPQVYSADLGYLNRLKSDAPCVSESEHVLHIYHNIMTLFI